MKKRSRREQEQAFDQVIDNLFGEGSSSERDGFDLMASKNALGGSLAQIDSDNPPVHQFIMERDEYGDTLPREQVVWVHRDPVPAPDSERVEACGCRVRYLIAMERLPEAIQKAYAFLDAIGMGGNGIHPCQGRLAE